MGVACSLYLLGRFALAQGDTTQAQSWLEESLTIFEAFGLQLNIAQVLSWLAGIALAQGERAKASALCERSIALFRQMDDQESMALCLQQWGCMVARRGDTAWAVQLWGVAEMLGGATRSMRSFDLFTLFTPFAGLATYGLWRPTCHADFGARALPRPGVSGV